MSFTFYTFYKLYMLHMFYVLMFYMLYMLCVLYAVYIICALCFIRYTLYIHVTYITLCPVYNHTVLLYSITSCLLTQNILNCPAQTLYLCIFVFICPIQMFICVEVLTANLSLY